MRQPVLTHRTWWGGTHVEELRSPWKPYWIRAHVAGWYAAVLVWSFLGDLSGHPCKSTRWRSTCV